MLLKMVCCNEPPSCADLVIPGPNPTGATWDVTTAGFNDSNKHTVCNPFNVEDLNRLWDAIPFFSQAGSLYTYRKSFTIPNLTACTMTIEQQGSQVSATIRGSHPSFPFSPFGLAQWVCCQSATPPTVACDGTYFTGNAGCLFGITPQARLTEIIRYD